MNTIQQQASIEEELAKLTAKHGSDRSALMAILHELQSKYAKIPQDHMQVLASMLNIHAVEVQDVATFYHFYNTKAKGKHIIRMCQTMPCEMAEAKKVAEAFEKELGIKFGETTKDGMFTLEWTSCLGMCDQGPAILVNYKPYTKVTAEEVKTIIKTCKEEAK
jgi:NADH:ubiquinone oxidoreductase subunit E